MKGELLAHELDEVENAPLFAPSRVTNIPRASLAALASLPLNKQKSESAKLLLKSPVSHNALEVLLNESHRLASGQVSPEAAAFRVAARKASGEFDALKNLGINYGQDLLPEGGHNYKRALGRLRQTDVIPKSLGDTAAPSLYNLDPETVQLVRTALRKRRGKRFD